MRSSFNSFYEFPTYASNVEFKNLQSKITDLERTLSSLENKLNSLQKENKITSGRYLGYDYVDLGMSIMWATCNVGANKPQEVGKYFAWGETTGYVPSDNHRFYWTNYFDTYSGSTFIIYNNEEGLTELKSEHDAVTANWGGKWRMPTLEEFQSLEKICIKKSTQLNGVSGQLFTSALTGESIFLPNAGYMETQVVKSNNSGFYWSCSLSESYSKYGRALNGSTYYRYYGFSVRGVFLPN